MNLNLCCKHSLHKSEMGHEVSLIKFAIKWACNYNDIKERLNAENAAL